MEKFLRVPLLGRAKLHCHPQSSCLALGVAVPPGTLRPSRRPQGPGWVSPTGPTLVCGRVGPIWGASRGTSDLQRLWGGLYPGHAKRGERPIAIGRLPIEFLFVSLLGNFFFDLSLKFFFTFTSLIQKIFFYFLKVLKNFLSLVSLGVLASGSRAFFYLQIFLFHQTSGWSCCLNARFTFIFFFNFFLTQNFFFEGY